MLATKTDSQAGAKGISLLLVEATRPGFTRGRNLAKLGMKAQDTSELFFENLRIPASNMLGAEGQGFPIMMTKLAQERLAQAIRLAKAGYSANEIASITGHATLMDVSRYTKAAEQKSLAKTAIDRLHKSRQLLLFPNLPEQVGKKREKLSKNNDKMAKWRSLRESNPSYQIENLVS